MGTYSPVPQCPQAGQRHAAPVSDVLTQGSG